MSADDRTILASEMKAALAPHFYSSPEIFAQEARHIFHAEWFCVGRVDQVPDKGDCLRVDVVDFRDIVNRQDWRVCEGAQTGMKSRGLRGGFYAPREDPSLYIRRYLASRLGEAAGIPKD